MGKTVRDLLVQCLENLEEKSFKKFRKKLNDLEIRKEYSRIPRGALEKADPDDVADLIRRYYKDSYGLEVTLEVLEAIDHKQEAEDLRRACEEVKGSMSQETTNGAGEGAAAGAPTTGAAGGKTPRDKEHFVMRHRSALIQRVVLVDPNLDDLYQWQLLTREEYNRVRSIRTSQEQMRELFSYVESWGDGNKEKFLESLRKNNPPLIKDLEGK